jgi:hypothetical protein
MPDDTSRASEHPPETKNPLAEKNVDNVNPDLRDAKGRPLRQNRQDGPLGDVSPRDETR